MSYKSPLTIKWDFKSLASTISPRPHGGHPSMSAERASTNAREADIYNMSARRVFSTCAARANGYCGGCLVLAVLVGGVAVDGEACGVVSRMPPQGSLATFLSGIFCIAAL
jgi:hypothetical protein